MFDLNLIPLAFHEGREQLTLPGLLGVPAPRRPARGREGDPLAVYLSFQGPNPPGPDETRLLLERTVQVFYQTPGPATTAVRQALDGLNQSLWERNAGAAGTRERTTGLLSLLAIHGSQVYLAQCGQAQAFLLTPQNVEHYTDPQLTGRGLGYSSMPGVHYYRLEITHGHYLLFSPDPPAAWNTSSLAGSARLAPDSLRRRLFAQSQPEQQAVLVQFQNGNGKVNLMRPAPRTASGSALRSLPQSPLAYSPVEPGSSPAPAIPSFTPPLSSPARPAETRSAESKPADPRLAGVQPAIARPGESLAPEIRPVSVQPTPARFAETHPVEPRPVVAQPIPAQPTEVRPAGVKPSPSRPAIVRPAVEPPSEPVPTQTNRRSPRPRLAVAGLVRTWQTLQSTRQQLNQFMRKALTRLLPGAADQSFSLSPGVMIFIAIAVPFVVVAIASAVYIRRGQGQQYDYYYAQAQTAVNEVLSAGDPQTQSSGLARALILLDKAEGFNHTDQSQALRQQAQQSLDALDAVTRLAFEPAIEGGLPRTTNIIQIVSVDSDLFMLDGTEGQVIHAALTGHGYSVRTSFTCGPGTIGGIIIGRLVDIVAMPRPNQFNAQIMAIDENGNLLYCSLDKVAYAVQLPTPDTGWGRVTAIAANGNSLYVLDPTTNAVWIYHGQDGGYSDRPRLFFDKEIPALTNARDLAINGLDLYIVHGDGHLSNCTMSLSATIEPTHCKDPALFTDPRQGREPNPTSFPEARFSQVQFISLPEQALYLLDSGSDSIYQFSRALALFRIIRPTTGGPAPTHQAATAFTVNPDRTIFLAFGSQVIYAYIP